jgi:hypothetical protein
MSGGGGNKTFEGPVIRISGAGLVELTQPASGESEVQRIAPKSVLCLLLPE